MQFLAWLLILPLFLLLIVMGYQLAADQKKFRELVKAEMVPNDQPWLPPLFGIDERYMSDDCRAQKKKVIRRYLNAVILIGAGICLMILINVLELL